MRPRKAGLRLDTEEGALRKKESVIVPGKSSDSEFIRRILTKDADELMPPADSNRKLSSAQKDLLKQWVDSGAKWARHWAFVRPVRPAPPASKDGWVRNDIDRFVLTRLLKHGIRPLNEADRRTLIRRVTLDLTGLPPTAEEIQAFIRDKSPKAFEKVVGRLLQSPHFGERMAWDWLDIARYADTNGYQEIAREPCGRGVIGWWRRSTTTCRMINSPSSNSRETCSRMPQFSKRSLPASIATT